MRVLSVEDLNRTERLILLQIRGRALCLVASSWDIGLFLPSGSS